MTLYKKDGSVYKLAGPNPIMKQQEIWTDFVIHNMKWTPEVNKSIAPPLPEIKISESFIDELEATKNKFITVVETKTTPEPEQVEFHKSFVVKDLENEPVQSNNQIEKTFIYCLPATVQERKDTLYGDIYKTIKYGDPTSFEAVVLSFDDLSFEIWTDIDFVSIGSILYPKTGFKRWWKVQEKIPKANGWILKSIITDYQPSFKI